MMTRTRFLMVIPALLLVRASVAGAQAVGTVAEVAGTVESGKAMAFTALAMGGAVNVGDEIRTGRPGRVRIVFQDGSVLTVGDNSDVIIDEQTFDPRQGLFSTAIRVQQGRVKALVSDVYQNQGAVYEIETVTAVASVHGTEFVMTYDRVAEVTEAVGISGRVEVHSQLDRVGRAAFVTAQEFTRVERGQYPTPPQRLPDKVFKQYLEGLEFIGLGRPESMTMGLPLFTTGAVAPQLTADKLPTAATAPPIPEAGARLSGEEPRILDRDAGGLLHQSPPVVEGIEAGAGGGAGHNNGPGHLGIHF